jgi:hypothetical protein
MHNNTKKRIKYDNIITHFTKKRDTIFKILICKYFIPKYNIQEIPYELDKYNQAAFPIVCFCDCDVDIMKHTCKYGKFGLGMKKEWAVKNGLNPVFYFNSNSFVTKNFKTTVEKLALLYFNGKINKKDWYNFLYIIAFTKEYGNKEKNEIYYEEREWRFFPIKQDGSIGVLTKTMYENYLLIKHENSKIEDNKLFLKFEIQDIEKIFIPKYEDIKIFKREIKNRLEANISEEDIKYLTNKVEVL